MAQNQIIQDFCRCKAFDNKNFQNSRVKYVCLQEYCTHSYKRLSCDKCLSFHANSCSPDYFVDIETFIRLSTMLNQISPSNYTYIKNKEAEIYVTHQKLQELVQTNTVSYKNLPLIDDICNMMEYDTKKKCFKHNFESIIQKKKSRWDLNENKSTPNQVLQQYRQQQTSTNNNGMLSLRKVDSFKEGQQSKTQTVNQYQQQQQQQYQQQGAQKQIKFSDVKVEHNAQISFRETIDKQKEKYTHIYPTAIKQEESNANVPQYQLSKDIKSNVEFIEIEDEPQQQQIGLESLLEPSNDSEIFKYGQNFGQFKSKIEHVDNEIVQQQVPQSNSNNLQNQSQNNLVPSKFQQVQNSNSNSKQSQKSAEKPNNNYIITPQPVSLQIQKSQSYKQREEKEKTEQNNKLNQNAGEKLSDQQQKQNIGEKLTDQQKNQKQQIQQQQNQQLKQQKEKKTPIKDQQIDLKQQLLDSIPSIKKKLVSPQNNQQKQQLNSKTNTLIKPQQQQKEKENTKKQEIPQKSQQSSKTPQNQQKTQQQQTLKLKENKIQQQQDKPKEQNKKPLINDTIKNQVKKSLKVQEREENHKESDLEEEELSSSDLSSECNQNKSLNLSKKPSLQQSMNLQKKTSFQENTMHLCKQSSFNNGEKKYTAKRSKNSTYWSDQELEEIRVVELLVVDGVVENIKEQCPQYKNQIKDFRQKYRNNIEISKLIFKFKRYTKREKFQILYEIYQDSSPNKYQKALKRWNLSKEDVDSLTQKYKVKYDFYAQKNMSLEQVFPGNRIKSYRDIQKEIDNNTYSMGDVNNNKFDKNDNDMMLKKKCKLEQNSGKSSPSSSSSSSQKLKQDIVIQKYLDPKQNKLDKNNNNTQEDDSDDEEEEEMIQEKKYNIRKSDAVGTVSRVEYEEQKRKVENMEKSQNELKENMMNFMQDVQAKEKINIENALNKQKIDMLELRKKKLSLGNLQEVSVQARKKKLGNVNLDLESLQVKGRKEEYNFTAKQLAQFTKRFHLLHPVYKPTVELAVFITGYGQNYYRIKTEIKQRHEFAAFNDKESIAVQQQQQKDEEIEYMNILTSSYQNANLLSTWIIEEIQKNKQEFAGLDNDFVPLYKGQPVLQIFSQKKKEKKTVFVQLLGKIHQRNKEIPMVEFQGEIQNMIKYLKTQQ